MSQKEGLGSAPTRRKRTVEAEEYLSSIFDNLLVCEKAASDLDLHINGTSKKDSAGLLPQTQESPQFFMDRLLEKLAAVNREVAAIRDSLLKTAAEF